MIAAAELLAQDWQVGSDVCSVTSFSELAREAREVERWNRLHPEQDATPQPRRTLLAGDAPVVAATDYVRAYPQLIASYVAGALRRARHRRLRPQRHARGAAPLLRGRSPSDCDRGAGCAGARRSAGTQRGRRGDRALWRRRGAAGAVEVLREGEVTPHISRRRLAGYSTGLRCPTRAVLLTIEVGASRSFRMTNFDGKLSEWAKDRFPAHGWMESRFARKQLRLPVLRLYQHGSPHFKRYLDQQIAGVWLQHHAPYGSLRQLAVTLRDLHAEVRAMIPRLHSEWPNRPPSDERDQALTNLHEGTERSEILLIAAFVLLRRLADQLIDATRPLLFRDWQSAPRQLKTAISAARADSLRKPRAHMRHGRFRRRAHKPDAMV